jgi:hypothetical protein
MPRACALAAPLSFFFFLPLLGAGRPGCSCEHSGQRAQFRQALHLRSHETLCLPVLQRRSLHQPAHRMLLVRLLDVAAENVIGRGGGGGGRAAFVRRFLALSFLACRHSCRASTLLSSRHTSRVAFEAARLRTPPTPLGAATFFLLRCRGGASSSARAAGAISATGSISSSGGVASLPVISHLLSFNVNVQLRPSAAGFVGGPVGSGTLTAAPS